MPCTAVNLLRLILNRTIRINRPDNSITYDEIRDGVFIEGHCVQRGLGISPATTAKYLKILTDNKLIHVTADRSHRNGFMYSIYSINLRQLKEFAMAKLPVPRHQRTATPAADDDLQTISKLPERRNSRIRPSKTDEKSQISPTSNIEVTEGSIYTSFRSKDNQRELKFSGRSAHGRSRLSRTEAGDTIEATMANLKVSSARRAAVAADRVASAIYFGPKGELKQQALMVLWNRTVREHYPGAVCAGATIKEFCIFRALVKPLFETISVPDLVHYLVAEWKNLLSKFVVTSSRWRASDVPDLPSVCKHWATIRPLLIQYYSQEAINERKHAGAQQKVALQEARATAEKAKKLERDLETERSRIAQLQKEQAEVYDLAARRGVSIAEERRKRDQRTRHTQELLRAQRDALDDDTMPEWRNEE